MSTLLNGFNIVQNCLQTYQKHCLITYRFVRTFSSSTPTVPNIKVEPSNYLDVDLGVNNDENRNTNHEGRGLSYLHDISRIIRDPQGQVSSQFYILGYYEDGLEQGGHLNDEDALEGNEGVFKVPSLPPELTGNGLKKKKLKSKGIMTKQILASVTYSNYLL